MNIGGVFTPVYGPNPIAKDVTIDASSLSEGVAIDGTHSIRMIQVTGTHTLTVKNLSFFNGEAVDSTGDMKGGAIRMSGGALNLINCQFFGCEADGEGGAIYADDADVDLVTSTFSKNSASSGGAFSLNNGNLTSTNATLERNRAVVSGGALWLGGAANELENLTIVDNVATAGGGVYCANNAGLTTTSCLMGENLGGDVENEGMAAVTHNHSLLLTASGTKHQLAPLDNYLGVTLTRMPYSHSPAIDPAGGASSTSLPFDQLGEARMINSIVDAGAVEAQEASVVSSLASLRLELGSSGALDTSFKRVIFDDSFSGQTIFLDDTIEIATDVFLDGMSLSEPVRIARDHFNTSRALAIVAGERVSLNGLVITNTSNFPRSSGILNSGDLTLNYCEIERCNGSLGGGLRGVAGSQTKVNYCTIARNKSLDGGGIHVDSDAALELNHSTLAENSSTGSGGAIHSSVATVINDCSIAGNYARIAGGGIYQQFVRLALSNSIVAENDSPVGPNLSEDSPGRFSLRSLCCINDLADTSLSVNGNILLASPKLAPLDEYGGRTKTMALLMDSPVIDPAGGLTEFFGSEQRGFGRMMNGVVDIGAVEAGPVLLVTNFRDSLSEPPPGSLRKAIADLADPSERIILGNSSSDIQLEGSLVIDKPVFIDGTGLLLLRKVDGQGNGRVFDIESTGSASLHGVNIFGGMEATGDGGGIRNAGTLFLNRSCIAESEAQNGGGIANMGTLRMVHSTIAKNRAEKGAGIYVHGGQTSLERSTIASNVALVQGGASIATKRCAWSIL